uniref:Uncharacterized protein n=1 Tax=Anopheles coluzzii TaxID=1518534 RepID=A0A8W7PTE7_ANOCL
MSALANPSAPKPAAEAAAAASVGCACTHSRTIGGVADFCRRVLPITDKTVFLSFAHARVSIEQLELWGIKLETHPQEGRTCPSLVVTQQGASEDCIISGNTHPSTANCAATNARHSPGGTRNMLEINAKLLRDQSAVFMCGEVVECLIDFIHPSLPEHKISQSNSDILENLAWATVQLHCYCNASFNEKGPHDAAANRNVGGSTSLNASNQLKGEVLHSTEPKILFCDLRLSPGEAKQFLYRETVPLNTPPTYRGIRVKYYYKITVATQRLGSTVQALNIPIRVLPLPLPQSDLDEAITLNDESNEDLAPNNPFLEKKRPPSRIEYALHYLRGVTARRRPNFFMINNKWGKVGRFCLFKSAYKLGEDIVATIDFSCGTIKCVQLSVTLQCEETELLHGAVSPPSGTPSAKEDSKGADSADVASSTAEGANEPERPKNISRVTNYSKHHEVCLGMLQTQPDFFPVRKSARNAPHVDFGSSSESTSDLMSSSSSSSFFTKLSTSSDLARGPFISTSRNSFRLRLLSTFSRLYSSLPASSSFWCTVFCCCRTALNNCTVPRVATLRSVRSRS